MSGSRRFVVLAFVAVLALLCGAAPGLADGGLLADQPLSDGTAEIARVAMAPNGYAAAAWPEALAGGQYAVGVATRPPGGEWSRPQLLGTSTQGKISLSVAVDASGDVAVAWEEVVSPDAHVFVASRAAGHAFSGPEQLTDATSVSSPDVGVDASGRVMLLFNASPAIVVRDFPAGGSALAVAPQTISSGSPDPCSGGDLAVSPAGDAVAAYSCGGAVFALRQGGSWNVSPPVADDQHPCPSMSTTNSPNGVAIDARGHAVGLLMTRVVDTTAAFDPTFCSIFVRETDTLRLVVPLAGFMTPLVATAASGTIDGSGSPLFAPPPGISPNGIVASWQALDVSAYRLRVRDFALDGTPRAAEQTIDPTSSVLASALAVGGDGRALLTWARNPGPGLPLPFEAATRPPGGTFSAPVEVTSDGSRYGALIPALDATGSGAIAYGNDTAPRRVHVRGFDAAAPQLTGVAIPASVTRGTPAGFAVVPFDVWGPVTVSWAFGDGAAAGGLVPTHLYARLGSYTVTVTATDALGNAASRSGVVQVVPVPRPVLSHLRTTHRRFRVGRRRTAIRARRGAVPVGTTFRFTLDQVARVRIGIGRCVPRRSRPHGRCKRFVADGTLIRVGRAGANRVPFSGRVDRRALRPGRYRATFAPTANGRAGAVRTVSFVVVR